MPIQRRSWFFGLVMAHTGCVGGLLGGSCGRPSYGPARASALFQTEKLSERHWIVAERRPSQEPLVRFGFPPPQDAYRGEVGSVRGELFFGEGGLLSDAKGYFEVSVVDVTMGEPDLDDSIRTNAVFLQSSKYPTSRYEIARVRVEGDRVVVRQRMSVTLEGAFELKGVSVPLDVQATIEPAHAVDGSVELHLAGAFELENLRETFHISGPGDETDAAGNRMWFNFHFVLVPKQNGP